MSTMHNPPHPGCLIRESMEALNISARELAGQLGVAPSTLQRVLSEKSAISPEMAVRLSAVIGSSDRMWLGLQADYDLWQARQAVDTTQLRRLA
jgi:addiction module HigA family antidote